MNGQPLNTPVVFTIFNQPQWVEKTFARIAAVKPRQLFLIADRAAPNHPTDAERCAESLAIVEKIDWTCDVYRNYSDVNLGPRRRISSGIDWVFEHVDRAIILEHDILAEPAFFYFVQEMLERYQDEPRVMHVSGYNPVPLRHRSPASYPYSYYFSMYGLNWGWATWRRAWKPYYDVDMKLWTPELQAEFAKHPALNQTMIDAFNAIHRGLDTWDYQWFFARILQSGLSVVSARNLARNIGFGPLATNTKDSLSRHAIVEPEVQEFPLIHPPWLMIWPSFEPHLRHAHSGTQWRNEVMKRMPKPWYDAIRRVARRLEKLRE